MKRTMLFLALLALLVLALPAAAQDEATPDVSALFANTPVTPPACSDAERAQAVDLINKGTNSFGQAGTNNAEANKTPAQYGTMLADYSGAVDDFFTNYYSNFPQCVDGILSRVTIGYIINNTMALNVLAVSSIAEQASDAPNADLITALSTAMATQTPIVQSQGQGIGTMLTQLATQPLMADWFPACTQDDLNSPESLKLDEYEQRYAAMVPALQDSVDNGTVDGETLLAAVNLFNDFQTTLTHIHTCADNFQRSVNANYIYGDTLIALGMVYVTPYVEADADADTTAKIDAAVAQRAAVLESYLTIAAGTPVATEASS
jgi:hypothetical protein